MSSRCDAPVTVPGVFSTTESDLGRRCARAAGHEGPHRWQARWESAPPGDVEAEIARDAQEWDTPEDEREDDQR